MWLANQTRPDISFMVNFLAGNVNNPGPDIAKQLNKLVKTVKCSLVYLRFPRLDFQSLRIIVFSDASFGNVKNGGSQGGFIILIGDKSANVAPIYWASKRLKRVVKSTMAAEALALLEAIDSAIFIRQILSEMLLDDYLSNSVPIECFVDNNDLNVALRSNRDVSEKRLRVEIQNIRDNIANDNLSVNWVCTSRQLADIFTKVGVSPTHILDVITQGKLS